MQVEICGVQRRKIEHIRFSACHQKKFKAPHSDIPILKISNRKDTLKSSLLYKRKVHTYEVCGFEDCDVPRVVHSYFCIVLILGVECLPEKATRS